MALNCFGQRFGVRISTTFSIYGQGGPASCAANVGGPWPANFRHNYHTAIICSYHHYQLLIYYAHLQARQ